MLTTYRTIARAGEHEMDIKKSRFLVSIHRISSEEEARTIIHQIKKLHSKANHHCHAFVLGDHSEIQRSSDDGEPSGTAGVPILEILKKNELVNVLVVVTRYFGGVKLGTGGLIRAYAKSTASAIQTIGVVEGRLEQEVFIQTDYTLLNRIQNYLEKQEIALLASEYGEKVTLTISSAQPELLQSTLIDLTNGQADIALGEKHYFEYAVNTVDS